MDEFVFNRPQAHDDVVVRNIVTGIGQYQGDAVGKQRTCAALIDENQVVVQAESVRELQPGSIGR